MLFTLLVMAALIVLLLHNSHQDIQYLYANF